METVNTKNTWLYDVMWTEVEVGFRLEQAFLKQSFCELQQEHGTRIVKASMGNQNSLVADGLWTKQRGCSLVIKTSDCVPVFFYATTGNGEGLIGAVHAGWRGTAEKVSDIMVQTLKQLGIIQDAMQVMIGHSIRGCHYEVNEDVLSLFSVYEDAIEQRAGKWYLDLAEVNKVQLIEAGISERNIMDRGLCTYCNRSLPSYRRDGKGCGMMYNYIRMI